jgi:hypothetical protein
MKPIAYIQKVSGEFSNINFLTAYIGLTKFQGYQAKFFEKAEEIIPIVTKETIVYGGIPVMDKVFAQLGVKPSVPYWPIELTPYMGRKTWQLTVEEVHDKVEAGESFFVKPRYEQKKKFTGRVMKKFIDLLHLRQLEMTDVVDCSEIVEFVSEYRFFAHSKLGLLGCKHYAGEWNKVVDFQVAEDCRKAFTCSPVAYSLDLGVTSDGRTLLVECNDALSLGCYGLDPSMFSIMIVDRWNEIVGKSS